MATNVAGIVRLRPRERQVLALAAHGLRNAAIAERLCLSEQTVKNYLTAIYKLLRVRNRTGATAIYWQTKRGA